jgi:hypothetical protein
LTLPRTWTPSRRRREIIQGMGEAQQPLRAMRTKARDGFIKALRDAHRWLDELLFDQTIESVCSSSDKWSLRIQGRLAETQKLRRLEPHLAVDHDIALADENGNTKSQLAHHTGHVARMGRVDLANLAGRASAGPQRQIDNFQRRQDVIVATHAARSQRTRRGQPRGAPRRPRLLIFSRSVKGWPAVRRSELFFGHLRLLQCAKGLALGVGLLTFVSRSSYI